MGQGMGIRMMNHTQPILSSDKIGPWNGKLLCSCNMLFLDVRRCLYTLENKRGRQLAVDLGCKEPRNV